MGSKNPEFEQYISRKQLLGAGETIQSYNHQSKLSSTQDKKPKLEDNRTHKEEDIDVVNDTDKQGKHLLHYINHTFLSSNAFFA